MNGVLMFNMNVVEMFSMNGVPIFNGQKYYELWS
jgi:hypothetical protein